ncbi:hypothetical protein K438DRAFT_1785169 [Mycena galopus ATCC 62051]|nr:hypothetical protein K438DRAFT_1785169 [Mycena galopus ATCC 62051]
MRGAERPAKVCWTRPFLLPLNPLTQDAARQTFIDIADDVYDLTQVDEVLLLTGNMPLAIDLIAHLVDSEGCFNVLSRWEAERTSLISEGSDKRSNLDLSICLSLASPRLASLHHAQALLGILSILPDGFSAAELLQCRFYHVLADNYLQHDNDSSTAMSLTQTSLSLAISAGERIVMWIRVEETTNAN